jgi:hypothetical protein
MFSRIETFFETEFFARIREAFVIVVRESLIAQTAQLHTSIHTYTYKRQTRIQSRNSHRNNVYNDMCAFMTHPHADMHRLPLHIWTCIHTGTHICQAGRHTHTHARTHARTYTSTTAQHIHAYKTHACSDIHVHIYSRKLKVRTTQVGLGGVGSHTVHMLVRLLSSLVHTCFIKKYRFVQA